MSKSDRASLNARLKSLVQAIGAIRTEVQTARIAAETVVSDAMVRLSLSIAAGAKVREDLGQDWRTWAVEQCKGFGPLKSDGSPGDLAPPTVYRVRNAGCVAEVLGDAVGHASYLALVPLYRFLASAKSEEDLAKAHKLIGQVWTAEVKRARNGKPTEESVRKAVESKLNRGTRGAAGRTAAERKAAQAAKRNTPTTTTETGSNTETVEVDPAALESLGKTVAAFVRKAAKDTGIPAESVQSIMLGTLRLAKEHGTAMVLASLAK